MNFQKSKKKIKKSKSSIIFSRKLKNYINQHNPKILKNSIFSNKSNLKQQITKIHKDYFYIGIPGVPLKGGGSRPLRILHIIRCLTTVKQSVNIGGSRPQQIDVS